MSGLAPRDVDFVTGLRTAKVITSGCRCARVIEVMMAARAASVREVVLVSGVRVAVLAKRVLERAPAFWRKTLAVPGTLALLEANVSRQASLGVLKPAVPPS